MFKLKSSIRVLISNAYLIKCSRKYSELSYFHKVGKEPLKPLTLGKLYEAAANKYSDREILICLEQNKRVTFKDLLNEADKLAAGLLKIGLVKGDRVGLWSPNLLEWQAVNIACARAGFILVALNPAYQASELEYCINKVQIKTIVCPDRVNKVNFYEIINKVTGELAQYEAGRLKSPNVPSLKSVVLISSESVRGTYNYTDVLHLGDEELVQKIKQSQDEIQVDNPVNIQFTSGTTGKPKAAVISHFSVVNNSYMIGERNELGNKHHFICVQAPFFHAYGIVISFAASVHFGATLVIPSIFYNSTKNLKAISKERCTMVQGTPTMFIDLINLQKQKQEPLTPEIALFGGSPCPPELIKQIKAILKVKKCIYGLTETTATSFQSLPHDDDKHISTVGHLGDHMEAKVVDTNGYTVPFGTPGELYLRGYNTMLGYWDDEDKTKETITRDFWLKTGDQFVLQEDGYGRIVGRIKDMIIRGGENIYPKEIEDFLHTHPDIVDCQIIGQPHERLGEEVCACIILKKNSTLTLESLQYFCKGNMAHFKIPTKLRIVESFPKTASGKVQKFSLKQQIEKEKL